MSNSAKDIKLGIICPGLGNQLRGFETFYKTLFNKLKGIIDVSLIKGAGEKREKEFTLPHIKRDSFLLGGKSSSIAWGRRYKIEQASFMLPLVFHLYFHKYNIVQLSDPDLALMLNRYKRYFQKDIRIIYTNAVPTQSRLKIKEFDFIQQTSKFYYNEALKLGVEEQKMALIPYGIETDKFSNLNTKKSETKKRYNIPENKLIILSAGSIDHSTKRMDYLISEVAKTNSNIHLVIAGQENYESEKVKRLGKEILNDKITFLTVSHEEMPAIYSLADIFVLCSLAEGFGFVFIEAMACSLPVIAHDHPSMRSIVGEAGLLIDMSKQGDLSSTLKGLIQNEARRIELGRAARERAVECYGWESLLPEYLGMYGRVVGE